MRRHKFKWIFSSALNLLIILGILYGMNQFGLNVGEQTLKDNVKERVPEEKTVFENGEKKILSIRVTRDNVKVRHDWFMIYLIILGIVYTVVALSELNKNRLEQLELREKLSLAKLENLKSQLHPSQNGKASSKKLSIPLGNKIYFIEISSIRYIIADGNYVNVFVEDSKHVLRESLNNVEQRLGREEFIRIHKSFIVNLEYIKELRKAPHSVYQVCMIDNQIFNVSKTYKSELLKRLKV